MDGLVVGFIVGYLVRVLIAISFNEYQTNKEFRKARIEVDLNKCCENAYNCGFERGKLEGMATSETKYRRFLTRQEGR